MERAFAIGILLICEGSYFFWLELVETPDNFEASGKVLIHGLHLKIEGYAEETVAMRGHVAGLHAT